MVPYYKSTFLMGLGAAAGASALSMDWHAAIRDFGVLASMVFFFTWASWKREERMSNRVSAMEDFNQTELLTISKASVMAVTDNTHALVNLREVLKGQPCLIADKDLLGRIERLAGRADLQKHIEEV